MRRLVKYLTLSSVLVERNAVVNMKLARLIIENEIEIEFSMEFRVKCGMMPF